MTKPRLRFAPSPSGYLHIGGARTALFNWLWARKTGGTFVLRIEDTDQKRSSDASRAAILEAMTWLGLDWDEGPVAQTDRLAIYREWSERLIRSGHAYRCYCPPVEYVEGQILTYPRTCRERTDEPDLPYCVRYKVDRPGAITYLDKVFKKITTPCDDLQDFMLMRSNGVPTYNFGAVVDDITMDITLVARGRDHMINTPLQILLYRAFDARVPEFAHLPLMLGPDGEKLSKRHGAVSVTEYRDAGYSPDAVLDYLSRFGWSSGAFETRLSRAELVQAFDWKACGKADGMFDPRKFLAVNYDHLKSPALTSDDEYGRRVLPFVHARGLSLPDVTHVVPAIRERAQTFVDAANLLDPLVREPPDMDETALHTLLVDGALPVLRDLYEVLATCPDWTAVEAHIKASGRPLKDIGQVARAALVGRTVSPSLFDVLAILGREIALSRVARAIAIVDSTR